ncbi:YdcF family protein [Paenarthrobacter sp. Z7-10]|uniref:YdcF family protein n=1 Tax=Paenarthrobacter sp. Z7-10 TaxID=2787635 RepID=UPI0022A92F87|nr:ElyC/SanA/YdcF family protein [Paenarthrobacter sp. Z7-10]
MPTSPLFARKLALRGAAAALAVFLLWLFIAFRLFYDVPLPSPERTDAVIMLGGDSDERLPIAEKVQESLNIPVLVLSNTHTPGNLSADQLCGRSAGAAASGGAGVLCFHPSDLDTRGEAASIGRLVASKGWKSITVVTSRYHVTRAAVLIRQCTHAKVQMVASQPDFGPIEWLRRFVIETGGLIDAELRPGCASS